MTDRPFISYSHSCEDVMLKRALSNVEFGFYIDIGAYDPVDDSITKVFYDMGWHGINFEPNPYYHDRLIKQRIHDRNLAIAVSSEAGECDLHVIGKTGLSTLQEDLVKSSANGRGEVQVCRVKTEKLSVLWDKFVPENQDVHFLKIDVEGSEESVIRGADWQRHRPWIVVVEATLPNSTEPSHHGWEPLLLAADYLFAYFDGVNRYYVSREQQARLVHFDRPANPMMDNFQPFLVELTRRDLEPQLKRAIEEREDVQTRLEELRSQNAEQLEYLIARDAQLLERLDGSDAILKSVIEAQARTNELLSRKPRALWERLVFRKSGKPKKLFRRILFHSNGKPRGIFRDLIIKKNGKPHAPFRAWLNSPEYQRLPRAVRLDDYIAPLVAEQPLSAYAQEMLSRLEARVLNNKNGD